MNAPPIGTARHHENPLVEPPVSERARRFERRVTAMVLACTLLAPLVALLAP